METKKCTKCGLVKNVGEFKKTKRIKNGITNWCCSCTNEYAKKWRSKNKQKAKNFSKKWRENNKEYAKKYDRQRYLNNPKRKERQKAGAAKWGLNNKEKMYRNTTKWKRNNKLKVNEYAKKDREKLSNWYIVSLISNFQSLNIKPNTIREHPELIATWRQQIQIKRILKPKKTKSWKSSKHQKTKNHCTPQAAYFLKES